MIESKTTEGPTCPDCDREFTRPDNLRRHIFSQHGPSSSSPRRKEVSRPARPPPSSASEEYEERAPPTPRTCGARADFSKREWSCVLPEGHVTGHLAVDGEFEADRPAVIVWGEDGEEPVTLFVGPLDGEDSINFEELPELVAAQPRLFLDFVIEDFKAALPASEEGEIVRFGGRDYRVEGGELHRVYWPEGEKHGLEEGDLFRVGETVYCVRSDGGIGGLFAELKAAKLSDADIVETILEQEAENSEREETAEGEVEAEASAEGG